MESTPGKRVGEFWKAKGYKSLTAFAEASGLKIGTLSALIGDRSAPSHETITALLVAFPDLSPDWLLLGRGSMLREGKKLEPFLPGGEVNKFGATVHPPGGVKAVLGENFGEDIDGVQAVAYPRDRQAFIQSLLAEIEGLKGDKKHLHTIIAETQGMNRELQKSVAYLQDRLDRVHGQLNGVREELAEAHLELRGKTAGNQVEAPGSYAHVPMARAVVLGLRRYDVDPRTVCRLRRKRRQPVRVIEFPRESESSPQMWAA